MQLRERKKKQTKENKKKYLRQTVGSMTAWSLLIEYNCGLG